MTESNRARVMAAAILAATFALPLLGAWVANRNLRPIFTFPPPLAIPDAYPRWSWLALAAVAMPFVALALTWMMAKSRRPRMARAATDGAPPERRSPDRRFPAWGWIASAWTIVWWVLAWTRLDWFRPWQQYTFFPLWLGFVISTNAVTTCRHGTCTMLRQPKRWLALFAISAAFWWVFEWLNRFTHNWHYLGVADFGPAAYAIHATVCFSTVLPAVSSVAELLATSARWQSGVRCGARLPWLAHRATGVVLIGAGLVTLVGIGAGPNHFYPALWASPLALLLGDSILGRRREIAAEVASGDWRHAATWAVAALICGCAWELWNVNSAAKWIYTVPYVDRWPIFEMPVLGYLGYLPFGLECYFVVSRTVGVEPFSSVSST